MKKKVRATSINRKMLTRMITVIFLLGLTVATYAWFNNTAPDIISLKIEDPTTSVVVEKYDTQNKKYVAAPSVDTANAITIDLGECTFYKWKDTLMSNLADDQYYRITVTNNVLADNLAMSPKMTLSARYEVTSISQPLLDIRPFKINYIIMKPSDSATYTTTFPSSGLSDMLPNTIPMTLSGMLPATQSYATKDFVFPDDGFSDCLEIVNILGSKKYQSVAYLKLVPNDESVESILNQIVTLDSANIKSHIILDFSFRSVPFYTPPPTP